MPSANVGSASLTIADGLAEVAGTQAGDLVTPPPCDLPDTIAILA
jgi:hypothetical protein